MALLKNRVVAPSTNQVLNLALFMDALLIIPRTTTRGLDQPTELPAI
jgi:hypothetical protein